MTRILTVAALVLGLPSSALAQRATRAEDEPPSLSVELAPYRSPRPPGAPPDPGARYLYTFELAPAAGAGTVEVVADRRLLSFVVHPEGSRRRYTCRHPDAPRTVPDGRVMRLGAGADTPVWREWIDLRMYCWGRALRAIDDGARVETSYGFARRGRERWVARRTDGTDADAMRGATGATRVGQRAARSTARAETRIVEGPELVFEARPAPSHPEGSARVELRARDAGTGGSVSFSVGVYSNGGTKRVYLRDDLFSFVVDGPMGRVTCALPRERIVPIVDFYRRITERRAARTSISSARWCPDGTFDVAGVYDVTPIVDLVYDGARYDLEAVTGRFEGLPVPIRVRRGDHAYVEQTPETPEPSGPLPPGGGPV